MKDEFENSILYKKALDQYKKELENKEEVSRWAIEFVEECFDKEVAGEVKASETQFIYIEWLKNNDYKRVNFNSLGKELKKILVHKRKADGIYYQGISKKENEK